MMYLLIAEKGFTIYGCFQEEFETELSLYVNKKLDGSDWRRDMLDFVMKLSKSYFFFKSPTSKLLLKPFLHTPEDLLKQVSLYKGSFGLDLTLRCPVDNETYTCCINRIVNPVS